MQTDADERFTPATLVGVSNDTIDEVLYQVNRATPPFIMRLALCFREQNLKSP